MKTTNDGWLEIRTDPIDLVPPNQPIPVPSGSIVPSSSASASATATATATPSASASPTPTAVPTPAATASPAPVIETEFSDLSAALVDRFGAMQGGKPRSATTIGPIIGAELIRSSAVLIIIGELFILAYLWIRFGFRFGTAAIVALLHDVSSSSACSRSSASSSGSSSTPCS